MTVKLFFKPAQTADKRNYSVLTRMRNGMYKCDQMPQEGIYTEAEMARVKEAPPGEWIELDTQDTAYIFGLRQFCLRDSLRNRLPVRDDVTEADYHRPPTKAEMNFGHGATHYRTFPLEECCYPGTRILKAWFVADDGLRYYR